MIAHFMFGKTEFQGKVGDDGENPGHFSGKTPNFHVRLYNL